jgi:hypothetical protein
VYSDECPCFNAEDVDDLLNFAEITGADPSLGYCSYYEEGTNYLSLYVSFYSGPSFDIAVSDTQCSSFRTRGMSVAITAEESGECGDLIINAGAKDQMADAGCSVSDYLVEEEKPLMNGK